MIMNDIAPKTLSDSVQLPARSQSGCNPAFSSDEQAFYNSRPRLEEGYGKDEVKNTHCCAPNMKSGTHSPYHQLTGNDHAAEYKFLIRASVTVKLELGKEENSLENQISQ